MSSAKSATLEANVAKAAKYLERFRASGVLNFIGGAPRAASYTGLSPRSIVDAILGTSGASRPTRLH